MEGTLDDKLLDIFIRTLKDNIQHDVHLLEQISLEKDFMVARKVESKNLAKDTRRTISNTSRENNVPSSKPPQPTRLTPQQMDETRDKGLFFNCDNNYSEDRKSVV